MEPLIQCTPASTRAAQARDLLGFERELVVVRDLLSFLNVSLGINDNLLLPIHRDDLGVTVGLCFHRIRQSEGERERDVRTAGPWAGKWIMGKNDNENRLPCSNG